MKGARNLTAKSTVIPAPRVLALEHPAEDGIDRSVLGAHLFAVNK